MYSAFALDVIRIFERAGCPRPAIVCESCDEASFGDARVTLAVDGLTLHVVNDRGVRTVEIGLNADGGRLTPVPQALRTFKDGQGHPTCPLEVLAVVKGWVSFDELVRHYDLGDQPVEYGEDTPPPGPLLELPQAMELLMENWQELVAASSDQRLIVEAGDVEGRLQGMLQEQIDHPPPRVR